jgi:hypothetical protein
MLTSWSIFFDSVIYPRGIAGWQVRIQMGAAFGDFGNIRCIGSFDFNLNGTKQWDRIPVLQV